MPRGGRGQDGEGALEKGLEPRYVDPAGRRAALVTPEAVTVDLPLADLGTRTLSILIDLMVILTLLYFVLLIGTAAAGVGVLVGDAPGWLVVVAVLALNFAVLWGFPVCSEVLWRGRTVGKAALGLRVVTVEGGPVRLRHSALRWLLAFVDFYLLLGIPAIISAMVTRRGQRLGDLAAGTVVIRDRDRRPHADQPVTWSVPPALQPYASTLDTSGLDADDYSLIRAFLLRAGSLPDDARSRVAVEVATTVAQRMRHTPPPGTHPEALLLSVAALMQHRGRGPAPAPPPRFDDPFTAGDAPSPW